MQAYIPLHEWLVLKYQGTALRFGHWLREKNDYLGSSNKIAEFAKAHSWISTGVRPPKIISALL